MDGKKEDHGISHERKAEIIEVPRFSNKCFSKGNLNSCNIDAFLKFKVLNISRITF